jgi:hypothetical protein
MLRRALGGPVPFDRRAALTFWLKVRNENVPAWQDKNPLITLLSSAGKQMTLTPSGDVLADLPYLEAREGWIYFHVPLAGNAAWTAGETQSMRSTQLAGARLRCSSGSMAWPWKPTFADMSMTCR